MTPNRTILVPMTMDPETSRALPHAVRLAELTGTPLVLFTWSYDDGEAALAQDHLTELALDLPVLATVDAHCTEERGPAAAIVRAASAHDARIVMAAHGRSGVGEAFLGSVAEEVLRRTTDPIVLVGPYAERARTGAAGPIVACVDGSDLAESALPVAAALAQRLHTTVELVEVNEPELAGALQVAGVDVLESGYLARTVTAVPEALRPIYEVLHGEPAEAIIAYAGDRAELIALATHGRTGARRVVLGSVAMQVVHHATCPVLVTPPAHR